jgi:hypothetical protein
MPIDYRVDHERRLVLAEGYGAVTADDIFAYQRETWSRTDVSGYDELVDMTAVVQIVEPTSDGMRRLAGLSAQTDPPSGGTRFAIVAPQDFAYGLGRMYEAYRALNPRSTKQIAVFRSREEAFRWLSRTGALDVTPGEPSNSA